VKERTHTGSAIAREVWPASLPVVLNEPSFIQPIHSEEHVVENTTGEESTIYVLLFMQLDRR
jgi:hypothetical protein